MFADSVDPGCADHVRERPPARPSRLAQDRKTHEPKAAEEKHPTTTGGATYYRRECGVSYRSKVPVLSAVGLGSVLTCFVLAESPP